MGGGGGGEGGWLLEASFESHPPDSPAKRFKLTVSHEGGGTRRSVYNTGNTQGKHGGGFLFNGGTPAKRSSKPHQTPVVLFFTENLRLRLICSCGRPGNPSSLAVHRHGFTT